MSKATERQKWVDSHLGKGPQPSIRSRIRDARTLAELEDLIKKAELTPGISTKTMKKIRLTAQMMAKKFLVTPKGADAP